MKDSVINGAKEPLEYLLKLTIIKIAVITSAISVQASSLAIPRNTNTMGRPASDLIYKNQILDPGEAAALGELNREQLSQLHPKNSKLWQNKRYEVRDSQPLIILNNKSLQYPSSALVQFMDHDSHMNSTYFARVRDPQNPMQTYRLAMSRYTHAMLMRTALMRKLGYYVPAPQFYTQLKVSFNSLSQIESFLERAAQYTGSNLDFRNWVRVDRENLSITLSHATLEYTLPEYYNYQWGHAISSTNEGYIATLIELFNKERAYRALIVPMVLADIPESLNRFAPTACEIINGNVVLTHHSADSFKGATREDILWVLHLLSELDQHDFEEIIEFSNFPQFNSEGKKTGFSQLAYTTLIHRVHSLFECFEIKTSKTPQKPPLLFDKGLVVQGKVQVELIKNSPIRYGHGDRESPFREGDFLRYLRVESVSTGIKNLLAEANKKLVLQGVNDLAKKRALDIQNKIRDHIKEKPNEIMYMPVESWGGFIGSVGLDAGRHITTGTYYDSQAPIQLVDTIKISGQIGYFATMDGLVNYIPSAGANARIERSYAHVRPITSIEEGTHEPLKNLIVSRFMNELGKNLVLDWNKELECASHAENWLKENPNSSIENLPECLHPLDAFFKDFREGEVLTITDSISFGPWLNVSSALDVLMGIQPINFINNMSFSLDAQKTALWQTSLVRTQKGIQVFFRDFDIYGFGAQLDINYFMNLLRWRMQKNNAKIISKTWVLDYDPNISGMIDDRLDITSSEESRESVDEHYRYRERLSSSIKSVLMNNNSELLSMWFKDRKFKIKHNLDNKEQHLKLLSYRHKSFSEGHNVRITWPENPFYPELNPDDEKVEVYSYRKGELKGWDWFGLLGDSLDGLLERRGFLSTPGDPNPANTLFGNARWNLITTEMDLSHDERAYKPVANIQNFWGGWNLSRNDFLKILKEINKKFEDANIGSNRIIFEEDFRHVKKIRYYKITSTLAFNDVAINKIHNLLLQKESSHLDLNANSRGEIPTILLPLHSVLDLVGSRILGGISDLLTEGQLIDRNYKPSDKSFYYNVMNIIGNGNRKLGEALYTETCKIKLNEEKSGAAEYSLNTSAYYFGTGYDCIEPWLIGLLLLRRIYPHDDKRKQAEWTSRVISHINGAIPLSSLLSFIGRENFSFFVKINGFREGDEDGDLEYFSNTAGDPDEHFTRAGGILSLYSKETGIIPTEIQRSLGSFR